MKKKSEEGKENLDRWLLTYADMITLLMLFFIVLYSMSNIDSGKYKNLAEELQTIFAGGNMGIFSSRPITGGRGFIEGKGMGFAEKEMHGRRGTNISRRVQRALQPYILSGKVRVGHNEMGISISLVSDYFFESGSANVIDVSTDLLYSIGDILKDIDNNIRIEGHTDNQPISVTNSRYRSNWELSSQRAINILEYFINYGVKTDRLSAAAYGDSRPLVPNIRPEDRAINRRVDIIIVEK